MLHGSAAFSTQAIDNTLKESPTCGVEGARNYEDHAHGVGQCLFGDLVVDDMWLPSLSMNCTGRFLAVAQVVRSHPEHQAL
jgi:hypothetical protein